jgi:hypothetical protein
MIRRLIAALGAAVAALALLAAPASAHDVDLWHEYDHAWVWGHNEIHVDDGECDGNSVYADYYVSTVGGSVLERLWDHQCQNLATWRNHYPQQITRFRLCEVNVGCTGWKYT